MFDSTRKETNWINQKEKGADSQTEKKRASSNINEGRRREGKKYWKRDNWIGKRKRSWKNKIVVEQPRIS